jgi:hypothetical protein
VLVAHVVMESGDDAWYLLPVEVVAGVKSLRLFPGLKGENPRWEGYRGAWEWLGGGGTGTDFDIRKKRAEIE